MQINDYLLKIIDLLNENDIQNVEVYYSNKQTKYIDIENANIRTFETVDMSGINVSGNYKGYHSATYIEKYDEQSIQKAAQYIKETAELNGKKERKGMFKPFVKTTNLDININDDVDTDKIIDKLVSAEKKTKELDKRVEFISQCSHSHVLNNIKIVNNNKEILEDSFVTCTGEISVVVNDNGIKNNASASQISSNFDDINYDKLCEKAVKEALTFIGAKPIKSGNYKVILQNQVAADILSYYMPIFNLERVNKGLSKLKDKLGKNIANSCFTLIDDPFYINGKTKRCFDDEGTKTYQKFLIKNGCFESYLYGKQEDGKSTGNSFRNSYRENTDVAPTNCIVENGTVSTDKMISDISEGVMITGADGLFAGINSVTGDFSLISNGYYIKDGKLDKPIAKITVGGNIYKLLLDIEKVSSDTECSSIYSNFVKSPSLLIKNLNIGGL